MLTAPIDVCSPSSTVASWKLHRTSSFCAATQIAAALACDVAPYRSCARAAHRPLSLSPAGSSSGRRRRSLRAGTRRSCCRCWSAAHASCRWVARAVQQASCRANTTGLPAGKNAATATCIMVLHGPQHRNHITELQADGRYANDIRYLRVWIQYVSGGWAVVAASCGFTCGGLTLVDLLHPSWYVVCTTTALLELHGPLLSLLCRRTACPTPATCLPSCVRTALGRSMRCSM